MNHRAVSVITVFFWVGIFILLWALVLGSWLSNFGAAAVELNNLTGGEAWIYTHLNLVVFIALMISVVVISTFYGGSR